MPTRLNEETYAWELMFLLLAESGSSHKMNPITVEVVLCFRTSVPIQLDVTKSIELIFAGKVRGGLL